MQISWRLRLILAASVLLSVSGRGLGDDSPKGPKGTKSKPYADLVAQLVSPNAEPIRGDESVRFPKGYDIEAQRRIDAVRQILHANIKDALPSLTDAIDDPRYCMTFSWAEGDAYPNYSVGKICEELIASHLEVYRDKIDFAGVTHWNRYNSPLIAKDALRSRRGRSLAELQIEAIEWAINLRKIDPQYEERRVKELAALKKLRDQIVKSGEPAKPQNLLRIVVTDQG